MQLKLRLNLYPKCSSDKVNIYKDVLIKLNQASNKINSWNESSHNINKMNI